MRPLFITAVCSCEPANCKSPYDRVFIIGLRGSELVTSFVLGVTMVVPRALEVATAVGAVDDAVAFVNLSV